VDVGVNGALVVVQLGLERRFDVAFEGVLFQAFLALLQRPLGAKLPFHGALGVGHGGAELLLSQ
jgi:hypothetical protein